MAELFEDACRDPTVGVLLTAYCFGTSSDVERERVEVHLLGCQHCWRELQRLEGAVRVLRSGTVAPTVSRAEIVSTLGVSGRLGRSFGGHAWFVVTVSFLYAMEWMIGVWSELGYSYDRFGTLAWSLSAPVACWVGATMIVALWSDLHATRRGETSGLLRSAAIVFFTLGILVAWLLVVLPAERTIQASFQTRTAAVGYLKDALLIFVPLLPFILPPFHAILQLQAELSRARHIEVLAYLSGDAESLAPRGVLFLSPSLLGAFFLVYGILKIVGANNMLDALTPGPHANLFALASYASTAIWLAIPVVALVWYTANLTELRRECVALKKLAEGKRRSDE